MSEHCSRGCPFYINHFQSLVSSRASSSIHDQWFLTSPWFSILFLVNVVDLVQGMAPSHPLPITPRLQILLDRSVSILFFKSILMQIWCLSKNAPSYRILTCLTHSYVVGRNGPPIFRTRSLPNVANWLAKRPNFVLWIKFTLDLLIFYKKLKKVQEKDIFNSFCLHLHYVRVKYLPSRFLMFL